MIQNLLKSTLICTLLCLFGCNGGPDDNNSTPNQSDEFITLSQTEVDVPSSGGKYNIVVTALCDWEFESDAEWLIATRIDNTLEITVEPSYESYKRNASIRVYNSYYEQEKTVSFTQHIYTPDLSVDKEEIIAKMFVDSTFDIEVTSNTTWVAESHSWITLDKTTGNAGTTKVKVSVKGSDKLRTGKITIKPAHGDSLINASVSVIQDCCGTIHNTKDGNNFDNDAMMRLIEDNVIVAYDVNLSQGDNIYFYLHNRSVNEREYRLIWYSDGIPSNSSFSVFYDGVLDVPIAETGTYDIYFDVSNTTYKVYLMEKGTQRHAANHYIGTPSNWELVYENGSRFPMYQWLIWGEYYDKVFVAPHTYMPSNTRFAFFNKAEQSYYGFAGNGVNSNEDGWYYIYRDMSENYSILYTGEDTYVDIPLLIDKQHNTLWGINQDGRFPY